MLLCVNYHYLRPTFPGAGVHGETPAQFRDQLERLAKIGTFVDPDDLRSELNHLMSLPERGILITFDDGLREQYDYALPILNEMGIPAIFFVNTQPIVESTVLDVHKLHLLLAQGLEWTQFAQPSSEASAKYPYDRPEIAALKYCINVRMSPDERRAFLAEHFAKRFNEAEMSRVLYMDPTEIARLPEVGTHGHGHENPERGYVVSKGHLYEWLERDVFAASYPFGNRAACAVEDVRACDCELAFTMERGVNADLSRPMLLGRISCADLPDEGPLDKLWDLQRCQWA